MHNDKPLLIHAFIICWTGFEEKAECIAEAIDTHVDRLTVIYSNKTDTAIHCATGDWVKVPDDCFYGKKFTECQSHFDADVHLQIQADAHVDNWPALMDLCRAAFQQQRRLGVWAPDVSYSPWQSDYIHLRRATGDKHYETAQTDGVCWALRADVDNAMRVYDYTRNNSGWGIEQAAIVVAMRLGLRVMRSLAIRVQHPQSTGYNHEQAKHDKAAMTDQFSWIDKTSFRFIVYSSLWRRNLLHESNYSSLIKTSLSRVYVYAVLVWAQCLRCRYWCLSHLPLTLSQKG